METPPSGALTWPSSDVPTPNGMIGSPWVAQVRTMACTSSAEDGNATASGGWFATPVVVLPCCVRTADATDRRSPNRWPNIASAALRAPSLPSPASGGGEVDLLSPASGGGEVDLLSPASGEG